MIIDFIYIDPLGGQSQLRTAVKTVQDENAVLTGLDENRCYMKIVDRTNCEDTIDDFVEFIEPRLREAYRVLKPNGVFYFQIGWREVHYCKVLLDKIFGRKSFINEIIWAFDYGAKAKWPAKHENILFYAKNPKKFTFNVNDIDRIPYMAPRMAGPKKAAQGKLPTDVWWMTIVGPGRKEKTGYPTQKPEALLERMVKASTNPGDKCLDFFAGSGTLGAVCKRLGRECILMDNDPEAIAVMKERLALPDQD